MRDGDEVGCTGDLRDDVLLLVDALPQRQIEPDDRARADRQLMVLADVEAAAARSDKSARRRTAAAVRGPKG